MNRRFFLKLQKLKTEKSLIDCYMYCYLSVELSDAFTRVGTDRHRDRQTQTDTHYEYCNPSSDDTELRELCLMCSNDPPNLYKHCYGWQKYPCK